MGLELGGLFSLVVFAIDIWVIVQIVQSPSVTGKKLLWVLIILLLPLVGLLLWLLFGPKR
ncbi:hypothetical protein FGF66_02815 [Chlorobaculum thiosulfatiphilum]|uniref:Cardiolipin synthase N-terminal domain-containing protein n=1 Tax=Chlorobaculum thiosulfatiphilum TaxID=115852 RepID=A0A5C4S8Q9_CHLTI|nr:PLDc N-terminal domain-containing protein [Chlorobaculum thiosulfatiphilum]TNJ39880.1 hypothetical protein FGF66_02815 [Chlorobaculum thiosulfatiphilum]